MQEPWGQMRDKNQPISLFMLEYREKKWYNFFIDREFCTEIKIFKQERVMRRKDREITDLAEIMDIVSRENLCSVAFCNGTYPYLIPVNYGAQLEDGKIVLYFHGAAEGTKLECLKKDPHVSYTIFSNVDLRLYPDDACKASTGFESVCGSGVAELVSSDERKHALAILMNHIGRPKGMCFDENAFADATAAHVQVWKIVTKQVTGKRHE